MAIIQNYNILDIIFVSILTLSTLIGLIRGSVREVLSLVSLALAIYSAFAFADFVSTTYVAKIFDNEKVSYIVSFALILIATIFLVTLVNLFISQLLRASGLSFINRLLGLVFGFLRGAVICCVIVLVLSLIPGLHHQAWWQNASLRPIFQNLTAVTLQYVPAKVRTQLELTKNTVQQVATQIIPTSSSPTEQTPNNSDKQPLRIAEKQLLQSTNDTLQQQSGQQNSTANPEKKTKTPTQDNKATPSNPHRLILQSYQEN